MKHETFCVSVPGPVARYYNVCTCGWASGAMGSIPVRLICLACEERRVGAAHYEELERLMRRHGGLTLEQDGAMRPTSPRTVHVSGGRCLTAVAHG